MSRKASGFSHGVTYVQIRRLDAEGGKLACRSGSRQDVANLGDDFGTDDKLDLSFADSLETRCGGPARSSRGLQEDHAVEDDPGHDIPFGLPCFSCQISSRTSSKKTRSSSSEMPLLSTSWGSGVRPSF